MPSLRAMRMPVSGGCSAVYWPALQVRVAQDGLALDRAQRDGERAWPRPCRRC